MNSDSSKNTSKESIVIFLVYLFVSFLLFFNAITKQIMIANGDAFFYDFPHRVFIAEQFRNFSFPFWFPYEFIGMPAFGSMQGGVLYPINWLYIIFLHPSTFNFIMLLHFALAGFFTFMYLRQINMRITPAFYGGAVFAFTGFIQAHKGHVSMINAATWLPLIILLYEKMRVQPGIKLSLLTGFILSIQFLAGHMQTTMLSGLLVFYYILFNTATASRQYRVKTFLFCILPYFICLLFCLPQLYSAFVLKSLSTRDAINFQTFSSYSFSFFFFPNFVFPDYLRKCEFQGYIGIFPLFLTLPVIIMEIRKNRFVQFFSIVALLSLILMLGQNTPICKIMYYVPVYNWFRAPARNLMLLDFALAVISAIGIEKLIYAEEYTRKRLNKSLLYIFIFIPCLLFVFNRIFLTLLNNMNVNNLVNLGENVSFSVRDMKKLLSMNHPAMLIPFIFMIIYFVLTFVNHLCNFRKPFIILLLLVFLSEAFLFINYDKKDWKEFTYLEGIKERDYFTFLKENSQNLERNASFGYNGGFRSLYENVLGVYSLNGNDPFINKNLSYMLYLDCYGTFREPDLIIKNNILLSLLGTRYILSSQNDYRFTKNYDIPILSSYLQLSDESSFKQIELKNWEGKLIQSESGVYSIKGEGKDPAIYIHNLPQLKNNTSHIISGEFKTDKNNAVHLFFDFYGQGYDEPEREFSVNNAEGDDSWHKFNKTLNTGIITADKVSLRMFTLSANTYEVKNITIKETISHAPPLNDAVLSIGNSLQNPTNVYQEKQKTPRYNIYENINFMSRAFSVKKVVPAQNIEKVRSDFYSFKINPSNECYVWEEDYEELKDIKFEASDVLIKKYSPNEVVLDVNVPENSGFIILSDQYYPQWRALVDNKPVKVYEVNGLIRGVVVPAGKHILKFQYYSRVENIFLMIYITLFISSIVLLLLFMIKNIKK